MDKTDKTTDLRKGLVTRSPSSTDNSMKPKGGSVDADTTRKETAPTPNSLGPRCA